MEISDKIHVCTGSFRKALTLIFLMILEVIAAAQVPAKFPEHPPRPVTIEVSVLQSLNFGTLYYYNTGGTVQVSPLGSRSSTGEVVLFGGTVSAGLFTVRGNKGTVVSFIIPDAFIYYFGLYSMRISDFTTDPVVTVLPNTANPAERTVNVGGTLHVGTTSNPAGVYSGTFSITVVQE